MVNGRWIKWLICFDRGLPPGKCCCLLLLEYSHLTKFFQVNKDKNWIMAYHQMRCLSLALSWGFFVLLASWACITLLTFCLFFFLIFLSCRTRSYWILWHSARLVSGLLWRNAWRASSVVPRWWQTLHARAMTGANALWLNATQSDRPFKTCWASTWTMWVPSLIIQNSLANWCGTCFSTCFLFSLVFLMQCTHYAQPELVCQK